MEGQEDKMPTGSGLLVVPRSGTFGLNLSGFSHGFPASSLRYGTRSDRKQELALCFRVFDVGMPLAGTMHGRRRSSVRDSGRGCGLWPRLCRDGILSTHFASSPPHAFAAGERSACCGISIGCKCSGL